MWVSHIKRSFEDEGAFLSKHGDLCPITNIVYTYASEKSVVKGCPLHISGGMTLVKGTLRWQPLTVKETVTDLNCFTSLIAIKHQQISQIILDDLPTFWDVLITNMKLQLWVYVTWLFFFLCERVISGICCRLLVPRVMLSKYVWFKSGLILKCVSFCSLPATVPIGAAETFVNK